MARADRKERIEHTIQDLVAKFLYYDRKESATLSADDLKQAVEYEGVTADWMAEVFRAELKKNLEN